MKKFIIRGKITTKEQLKNSVCGNPRERVIIKLEPTGEEITATTATDSGAGHLLSCSMEHLNNRLMDFEVHYTKKYNLIITRILSGYYGE